VAEPVCHSFQSQRVFLGKLLDRERGGAEVINTSEVVFTMDRLKENRRFHFNFQDVIHFDTCLLPFLKLFFLGKPKLSFTA
jgi:hypothetical protein